MAAESNADSFFDKAKDKINEVKEERRNNKEQKKEQKKQQAIVKDQLRRKATLPDDLPDDWALNIIIEPVFNSEILVAEAGNYRKPVIFLVHGLGQLGMRDWLTVVPALKDKYRVIMLDLPGFGGSGKPRGRYSPTNYAKVLSALKQELSPSRRISVVGHSMGGAVTLRYASLFPEEVKQVVLVDVAGVLERTAYLKHSAEIPLDTSKGPEIYQRVMAGVNDKSSNFIELVNGLPEPTSYIRTDDAWGKAFSGRTNVNAAFALMEEDFSSAIYNFNVRSTIIWGSEDRVAPLRTGKVLAEHLKGTRFHVIDGAGHVPMKSHTEQFNLLLLQALDLRKKRKPQPNVLETAKKGVLKCNGETGLLIEGGHYKKIEVNKCVGLILRNLSADKVVIKHSLVEMDNVTIESDKTALFVRKSTIVGTNLKIKGKTAVYIQKARIDFAGTSLIASSEAVRVKGKSRILFSVSKVDSPGYQGTVHGKYRFKKGTLEKRL